MHRIFPDSPFPPFLRSSFLSPRSESPSFIFLSPLIPKISRVVIEEFPVDFAQNRRRRALGSSQSKWGLFPTHCPPSSSSSVSSCSLILGFLRLGLMKSLTIWDWVGGFARFRSRGLVLGTKLMLKVVLQVFENRSVPSEISRISIHVNSQLLPTTALNDLLSAHRSPAVVSRFSYCVVGPEDGNCVVFR
ncbi:hypothetical protein Droror1_Dr00003777 [Drosera rotundifolia]